MFNLNEFEVQSILGVWLALLFIIQLRTKSWTEHRIPITLTGVFLVNSIFRAYVGYALFISVHILIIVLMGFYSVRVFNTAKQVSYKRYNPIPYMIAVIYAILYVAHQFLSYSAFITLHGFLIILVATTLTLLPIYLAICNKQKKDTYLKQYIF